MISPDGIKILTFYFTWERVAVITVAAVVLNFVEEKYKQWAYGDDKKKKKKSK